MDNDLHAIRLKYNLSGEKYSNYDTYYNPVKQKHTRNRVQLPESIIATPLQ